MTYFDRITELTKQVPATLVNFETPRNRARQPSPATSEFITHNEQGNWAERLISDAINGASKNYVVVKYGKSDDIVAGEVGFREFFDEFQTELDTIGKRPDLLIFRKADFDPKLGQDISGIPFLEVNEYVKKAVAGVEVRSSAYLSDKYQEATKARRETNTARAMEVVNIILTDYRDLLENDKRRKYIELLKSFTTETLTITNFNVPGWYASSRLVEVNALFHELKACIREIQKPDDLGITPKAEDIKVIYKWIETFKVPHFYFQVFFDKIYGLSFENILKLLIDPDNEGDAFRVGGDPKNQNKVTFKIKTSLATLIAAKVDEPTHSSVRKEIGRGRLLFYVKFDGGTAYLDVDRLREILGIEEAEF